MAIATAAIHTLVGGYDSLAPMLSSQLPAVAEGALHASWHMVALFLAWSGVVFWNGGPTSRHFAGLWCAFALIFIAVNLWQAGPSGLLINPQWTILAFVGVIAWLSAG